MEENKNPFPKFDLFPRITKVCRAVSRLALGPHLFSPVSDHEFRHPLDEIFDKPPYSQDALFAAELSGWGTDVGE